MLPLLSSRHRCIEPLSDESPIEENVPYLEAIKHVVTLADPAEASARRAQRNWGIITMDVRRKLKMGGALFGAQPETDWVKKKKVKRLAAPPGLNKINLAAGLKSSNSKGGSGSGSGGNFGSRRGSNDVTPNPTPRHSNSWESTPWQVKLGESMAPQSPRLFPNVAAFAGAGAGAATHASRALPTVVRSASAAAAASTPPQPTTAAGANVGVVAPPAAHLPAIKSHTKLPPPPVDLPDIGFRHRGGTRAEGGERDGGRGVERRSSARIASGQNSGVPARVRLENAGGGGGGGDGGGVGADGGGAGTSGGGVGCEGGSSTLDGGISSGDGAGPADADRRHFELPLLSRLPSREPHGIGVGLLPAGLFEFSTDSGDRGHR